MIREAEKLVKLARQEEAETESRLDEEHERRKLETLSPLREATGAAERFVDHLRARAVRPAGVATPKRSALPDDVLDELASQFAEQEQAERPQGRANNRKLWPKIAGMIGTRTVTGSDVVDMFRELGREIQNKQARRQLSAWAESGVMERVSDGNYRFTAEGRAKFGVPDSEQTPSNVRALHTG